MNNLFNTPIIQILWIVFISFICSFSKELNSYIRFCHKKSDRAFLIFMSNVFLSSVCGVLIGALTRYLKNNIYLVTFFSGVGGMLGFKSIKIAINVFLSLKNINLTSNQFIEDEFKKYNDIDNHTIKKIEEHKKKKRRG